MRNIEPIYVLIVPDILRIIHCIILKKKYFSNFSFSANAAKAMQGNKY